MNWRALAIIVGSAMTVAACSNESPAPPAQASAGPVAVDAPEEALPPANLVNLALADMGGAVEELTGNYGPGFTGRRLVDGLLAPTWKQEQASQPVEPFFPQEAVISFFEREAGDVEALEIILADDPSAGPKDVEIWTSMTRPYENFSRVAVATLEMKSRFASHGRRALNWTSCMHAA